MRYQFFIFITLFILVQFSATAQRQERIQAFRAEVFTEELQLTDTESSAFFPMYETYTEERRDLQQKHKQLQRQLLVISDEEASTKIEELFQLEEAEIDLKRRYFKQFLTVLPIRKVLRIPAAEREFKKELLEKARDRRRRQ
ncbi:MAG: hypothetical protein AAGI23_20285 [Bacteroidota bacterium]